MKNRAEKAKKAGKTIGIVLALVAAGFLITTLVTWGTHQSTQTYTYNASNYQWSFSVKSEQISIVYTDNVSAPVVNVQIDFDYSGGILGDDNPNGIYDIVFDMNAGIFSLTKKLVYPVLFIIDRTVVTVTLREDITYDLTLRASSGAVKINIPENVTLNGLDMVASSGVARVTATKTNFTNGLSVNADSGNVVMSLVNCDFGGDITGDVDSGFSKVSITNAAYTNDINLILSADSGDIDLDIIQLTDPGANVSASMVASSGTISIDFQLEDSYAGATFNSGVDSGDVFYPSPIGFTRVFNVLSSTNYPSGIDYNFVCAIGSGTIIVDAELV
ncbi:MAG: DUF4097 family beta strand repeat-containing protein [Candidatus Hodarchaeota archaeon]